MEFLDQTTVEVLDRPWTVVAPVPTATATVEMVSAYAPTQTQTITAAPTYAPAVPEPYQEPFNYVGTITTSATPVVPDLAPNTTVPAPLENSYIPNVTTWSSTDRPLYVLNNNTQTFDNLSVDTLGVNQLALLNGTTFTNGQVGFLVGGINYFLEADTDGFGGADLYFNGQLLAAASNIQDIADWALYKASANVDMDDKAIENCASVQFNIPGNTTVMTVGDDGVSPQPTAILATPLVGTYGVAKPWSYYDALTQVNFNSQTIEAVGQINMVGAGTLAFGSGDSLFSDVGILNLNSVPVASGWSVYQASQTVDLNANALSNVGDIDQENTRTANLGTLVVASNATFNEGLELVDTVTGSNSLQSTNGALLFDSLPVARLWAQSGAVTDVDMSGNAIENCISVGIQSPGGSDGFLTTSTAGSVLLFNGQPISTGSGGNTSQWSTFPSVNNTILPNSALPSTPLTLGTRAYGTNVNIETNQSLIVNADNSVQLNAAFDDLTGDSTFTMTDSSHTLLMDRGQSLAGQGLITLNAKNGTGGRINIYADSSSAISPAAGGLVDITAYSAIGSVSPLALSRVNVEAATVTVTAGSVGTLAYVPGSVNLLSAGVGTGIQLLTTVGVINIASGVACTVSGGLGVYLNGASSGVNVAGGNLYITNGNQLSCDQVGAFSSGGSIGFVSPIVAGKIADSASSYGTAGQVATATGSGSNWTWSAPTATGVTTLNGLSNAVTVTSTQLTVGTSGQNVTVNVPASLEIPTVYANNINPISPTAETQIFAAKVIALRSDNATLPLLRDGALSQGTAGQVATANGTTGWSWAAPTAAGVGSINTLTGAITLAAGTDISLVPVGNTITINQINKPISSRGSGAPGTQLTTAFTTLGTVTMVTGAIYDVLASAVVCLQTNTNTKEDISVRLILNGGQIGNVVISSLDGINHYITMPVQGGGTNVAAGTQTVLLQALATANTTITVVNWQMTLLGNVV